MIFRTILFFLVMYLLIRIISRLFLPSNEKSKGKRSFFHRNFQRFTQQNQNRQNNNRSSDFEEIEEAEFEDITDDEKSTSKTSD